jgi:class 3 adenylate cyclase
MSKHRLGKKRSRRPHKRRGRRPNRRRPRIGELASAGFVLICDIVGFSLLEQPDQVRAVTRLWEFLESHPLLKPRFDGAINGTGDGALLTWSQRGQTTVSHAELLEFGENLLAYMRGTPQQTQMRIGIHVGQFRTVEPSPRLGVQLVGTGLNECARVSSLGDEGHIVVSEDFLRHWRKAGNFPEANFYPRSGDPIIAFVKHDEPLGVRVYLKGGHPPYLPEKLRKLLCIDSLIEETLSEIESAVVTALIQADSTLSAGPVSTEERRRFELLWSPRVSVFSPFRTREGARKLCPTQYRYHQDPLLKRKGVTEYAIDGTRSEGPLAKAFQYDNVQVLHRLPPVDDDKYVVALAKVGIDEAKIRKMSRPPRAFLCFPFGLKYGPDPVNGAYHQDPEGVVCIDLDDDLATYDEQRLEVTVRQLREFFNNTLSAFWRLRTS